MRDEFLSVLSHKFFNLPFFSLMNKHCFAAIAIFAAALDRLNIKLGIYFDGFGAIKNFDLWMNSTVQVKSDAAALN